VAFRLDIAGPFLLCTSAFAVQPSNMLTWCKLGRRSTTFRFSE